METARSTHELEVAVNAAEEELSDAKEALKDVHLQAYYEDDLSLFAEEDIKKAMLKEGESLHGTYDSVSKASFTKQQLKQVIQTRWVVQPRPAQDGETSLRARFVAKGFKQQILDPSLETYASTPSSSELENSSHLELGESLGRGDSRHKLSFSAGTNPRGGACAGKASA